MPWAGVTADISVCWTSRLEKRLQKENGLDVRNVTLHLLPITLRQNRFPDRMSSSLKRNPIKLWTDKVTTMEQIFILDLLQYRPQLDTESAPADTTVEPVPVVVPKKSKTWYDIGVIAVGIACAAYAFSALMTMGTM